LRNITWDDLTINNGLADCKVIYADWNWLLTGIIRPLMISKFGDMFFQRQNGCIYFLDTLEGTVSDICDSEDEFEVYINQVENIEKYLLSDFVYELVNSNQIPNESECYSFLVPPVLGGKIGIDNISIMNLAVSMSLLGQLHRQVKNMPEGYKITDFKLIDRQDKN
jgi:hypothetical protein